jgi:hypothetical protein
MTNDTLVTIATYSMPHEAHIARASLEAADIYAFIANEHTIGMQWFYSNALGGVRLMVAKSDVETALGILGTDFSEELNNEIPIEETICPICGSTDVEAYTIGAKSAFVTILLLGFPLLFVKHGIRCRQCGTISEL